MRQIITLVCTVCNRENYTSRKNKKNTAAKVSLKKYCPWDRKHTLHKEKK